MCSLNACISSCASIYVSPRVVDSQVSTNMQLKFHDHIAGREKCWKNSWPNIC